MLMVQRGRKPVGPDMSFKNETWDLISPEFVRSAGERNSQAFLSDPLFPAGGRTSLHGLISNTHGLSK